MKYAVCVMAHSKPALLKKLVEKINSDNVEVFIHLDAKCNLSEYSHIKDVTFIERRLKVYWGGRSMVMAMYNLIDYVVNNSNCDYLLFISGQDYPNRAPKHYDDFINGSSNYIEYVKLPRDDWNLGGINRISNYYLFNTSSSFFSRVFVKMQNLLNIKRKYWKNEFEIYGGSQWININLIAAKYILTNWNRYYQFFKYTHAPDELIFQTILMNSPLKSTIVNKNFRYYIFEHNAPSPVNLNETHYDSIINSESLFARKILDEHVFEKMETDISFNENKMQLKVFKI